MSFVRSSWIGGLVIALALACAGHGALAADDAAAGDKQAAVADDAASKADDAQAQEQAQAEAKQQAEAEAKKAAAEAKKKADAEAKKKADEAAAKKKQAEAAAKKKAQAEAASRQPAGVSFRNQIAPILASQCVGCHGPDLSEGEFRLDTFEHLMTAGASTLASITPKDVDDSEVLRLVASDDEGERMPKDGDPLPKEQVELIRRWIAEGAVFDGGDPTATLASYLPRKEHEPAPEKYRAPVAVTALAFSPDGKLLAASGYHEITLWNAADGKLVRRIGNVEQRVYALAFSADGKLLASAGGTPGRSGEIALYDPSSGKLVRSLATTSDVAFDVQFDPQGKKLAAAAADRSVRVFDVASGKQEQLIEDHADWVMAVAWSPDGKRLASASRDKTSKVFDVASGDSLTTFPGHNEPVLGVTFSADGKQVYTAAADKRVRIWNPDDGKEAANITGWGGEIYELLIADDRLMSCSADKTARVHQLKDRKQLYSLSGHADSVFTLSYHADSKRLASGSYDGEIRIWNTDDGKLLLSFSAAPGLEQLAANQPAQK